MSTGLNVLRYSALAFGVFYGITHQMAVKERGRKAEVQHEFQRKQDLISEAKAEFAKKNAPQQGGDDVITDPENPNFDLEKFLNMAAEGKVNFQS